MTKRGDHISSSSLSRDRSTKAYTKLRAQQSRSKKIKITIAVIAAIIIGVGAFAMWYITDIQSKLVKNIDPSLKESLQDVPKGDPFYMLLLGTDRDSERENSSDFGKSYANYRTDSIILARIDPKQNQVTLVSIHRDTEYDFGGRAGKLKINSAYSLGGAAYAVKTMSDYCGVPISHYAEINFDEFLKVVDTLGGVEVNVPIDIDDEFADYHIKKGLQVLDGDHALALCRSRHAYDDYGDGDSYRAANQRLVIGAIVKKILKCDVFTMTSTISNLAGSVTTDMSLSDILGLALQMKDLDTENNIYSGINPTTSVYKNSVWYEESDDENWKKMMDRVDRGLSPYESEDENPTKGAAGGKANVKNSEGTSNTSTQKKSTGTVEVLNGAGIQGLAARVSASLERQGYTSTADNAKHHYNKTVIAYMNASSREMAEKIANSLGGEISVENGEGTYSCSADVLVVCGDDLKDYS